MKTKRLLAIIMVIAILMCLFAIPVSAEESTEETYIEIFFEDENVSEELKAKAIAFYTNPTPEDDNTTYGLTCTLLGHKIETTTTYSITHKARTTAPRCLKRLYEYEACTRCDDYEKSTLISSTYIYCCS